MECRNCHKELKEHARFCAECGTPVPLDSQINTTATHKAAGTRDQCKHSDLVYPQKTPLSPHLCWLNLLMTGLAQIIYGQVGKGLVMLGLFLLTAPILLGFLIAILSIVDAYMVGACLKKGDSVGKWQFFPGA